MALLPSKRTFLDTGICLLVAATATYIAAHLLGLTANGFDVPLRYGGDSLFYQMLIKGILDHHDAYFNPDLGAPFGLDYRPFPIPEPSHFALIRVIGLFTRDSACGYNAFYLAGFATAAASAYAVMRKIGLSRMLAATGALLFALQSFHFQRPGHLFLASYWCIPVFVLLALRIAEGNEPVGRWQRGEALATLATTFIIVLAVGSGAYYVFFGCLMIGVAALLRFGQTGDKRAILQGICLIFGIGIVFAVMMLPTTLYNKEHADIAAFMRIPAESETYGLRLIQLLLPWQGHRIEWLRQLAVSYKTHAPLTNENMTASLGVLASIGFMISLISALFARRQSITDALKAVIPLGMFNLTGLLYATIGGFGAIFAWTISPSLRGLNRISIEMAFLGLCALLLCMDILLKRLSLRTRRLLCPALCLALLAIGYVDQTAPAAAVVAGNRPKYDADRRFGQHLNRLFGQTGRIYQLPYIAFPEAPILHQESSYDAGMPYLHTAGLAFSYGAMRSTPAETWLASLETIALSERFGILKAAGFNGILVMRKAYPDNGAAVEAILGSRLGAPVAICPNQECAAYKLDDENLSPVLHLSSMPGSGWLPLSPSRFVPAIADATATAIFLMNPSDQAVPASVSLSLKSSVHHELQVRDHAKSIAHFSLQAGASDNQSLTVDLPPGVSKLNLEFDTSYRNSDTITLQALEVRPIANRHNP